MKTGSPLSLREFLGCIGVGAVAFRLWPMLGYFFAA
jgi:hypothetical protein